MCERQGRLQIPETEAALHICSLECLTVQKSKVLLIVQQKALSLTSILSPVTFSSSFFFFKGSHNKGTGENMCYVVRLYCIPTLGSSQAAGDLLKVLKKRRNYISV